MLFCSVAVARAGLQEQHRALGRTINKLGVRLYRIESKNGIKTLLSPYSIALAMELLYEAAAGDTRQEIGNVTGFDGYQEVAKIFGEIRSFMRSNVSKTSTIMDAVGIFPNIDLTLRSNYIGIVQGQIGGDIMPLNFDQIDESASILNDWVSNNTKGLIEETPDANTIRPNMGVLLINTIYFAGEWLMPFPIDDTRLGYFYLEDGQIRTCSMMRHKALRTSVGTNQNLGVSIIELPYSGEDVSMYIVLPDSHTGLRGLEENLTSSMLNDFIENMKPQTIGLKMPKFTTAHNCDLTGALRNMGAQNMFIRGNYSRMTSHDVVTSRISHHTVLEVAENGTRAAAVTTVSSLKTTPTFIVINHPFLFFIRHKPSDILLFLGRVGDPGNLEKQRRPSRMFAPSKSPNSHTRLTLSLLFPIMFCKMVVELL